MFALQRLAWTAKPFLLVLLQLKEVRVIYVTRIFQFLKTWNGMQEISLKLLLNPLVKSAFSSWLGAGLVSHAEAFTRRLVPVN